jgi:predicted ATPase
VARAEGEFRRALEIARAQSARLFELRAARDLARPVRDQGRSVEARALLAPVYAAFTEGFGFPDLVEARALLEDLGVTPADDARRSTSSKDERRGRGPGAGRDEPAGVPRRWDGW